MFQTLTKITLTALFVFLSDKLVSHNKFSHRWYCSYFLAFLFLHSLNYFVFRCLEEPNQVYPCILPTWHFIITLNLVPVLILFLVCQLPKDPGPCTAREARYYFDTRTRRCEQFTFGGCQGNANKFSSQSECERACHELLLEKEVGELAVIFSQFDIHRCENTSLEKWWVQHNLMHSWCTDFGCKTNDWKWLVDSIKMFLLFLRFVSTTVDLM